MENIHIKQHIENIYLQKTALKISLRDVGKTLLFAIFHDFFHGNHLTYKKHVVTRRNTINSVHLVNH